MPKPDFRVTRPVDQVLESVKELGLGGLGRFDEDDVEMFGRFVSAHPLEISEKSTRLNCADFAFQYEFFDVIEESVLDGESVDWGGIFSLVKSLTAKTGDDYELMSRIYHLFKTGLKEDRIGFEHKEKVWEIISVITCIGTRHPKNIHPDDEHDALAISINGAGGMSFHMLFCYVMWCEQHTIPGHFEQDAKSVLDGYIKDKGIHVVSRHAMLGLYLPVLYRYDAAWTRQMLSDVLSPDLVAAFWEPYLCYNSLYADTFDELHVWYGRIISGKYDTTARLDDAALVHLMIAYLYDLGHSEHFEGFLDGNADDLQEIVYSVAHFIQDKRDDERFNKKKFEHIWQHPKFSGQPGLEMWFMNSPLDQKTSINLHLEHLKRLRISYLSSMEISELAKYAKYPRQVSECLMLLIQKQTSDHIPIEINMVLKLLLKETDRNVIDNCNEIKRCLSELNFDYGVL